jgi:hypothetical protein
VSLLIIRSGLEFCWLLFSKQCVYWPWQWFWPATACATGWIGRWCPHDQLDTLRHRFQFLLFIGALLLSRSMHSFSYLRKAPRQFIDECTRRTDTCAAACLRESADKFARTLMINKRWTRVTLAESMRGQQKKWAFVLITRSRLAILLHIWVVLTLAVTVVCT